MERLPEIIQGYSANDIPNMNESGLFFKALPDNGLAKKLKSVKATYCGIFCVLEWVQGL